MNVRWAVVTILILPLLGNAAEASDPSPEDKIRAALHAWVAAANRGDWKEALDVWAPDLVGWYPGMPDDTYEREKTAAAQAGAPRTVYEVDVKEVLVSGPLAVVRDAWTFTSKLPDGKTSVEKVKSFEAWRLQPDGKWRISRWISAPEPNS